VRRIQLILGLGFPIALALVVISSWGLSGLAMQPIYQSYQQQQQFTANAAHELRSPLASLLATVEAILRVPANQQNIDLMLKTIERQGRRLSHLIADLLLLSHLEQNTFSKPFKPCCMNDIISDLFEEFSELAVASNIQLYSDITQQIIYVYGDEQQLYRLVSNLIANAIQYTPTGGSVHISLKQRYPTAIIIVKDTGIGISAVEQQRIFERFYRVNSDRSRQTGGTGLGLAIAQAIALKHRAYLKVESELGQGSLFRLEIPIVG
jgi:two-component Ni(II)/redox sensor kinase NrsS